MQKDRQAHRLIADFGADWRVDMTEIEAIMDLQEYIASGEYNGTNPPIYLSTANISIKALEKQIAKKPYVLPINREEDFTYCPICERNGTLVTPSYRYCTKCGQKLDWGNEDAE